MKIKEEKGHLQSKRLEQVLPLQPSEQINPTDTLILDFLPQDFETINFCHLGNPAYGTLLWQP